MCTDFGGKQGVTEERLALVFEPKAGDDGGGGEDKVTGGVEKWMEEVYAKIPKKFRVGCVVGDR
jgi:hypothetical protein